MKALSVPVPRWAVSFADLVLLLLGCFVLLHAMESARPKAAAAGAALPQDEAVAGAYGAAALFQPGEARLTEDARAMLQAAGRRLAGRKLRIISRGTPEGSGRLDRFELGAARAAAVGRALQQGGVAERDIALALEESASPGSGQSIAIIRR